MQPCRSGSVTCRDQALQHEIVRETQKPPHAVSSPRTATRCGISLRMEAGSKLGKRPRSTLALFNDDREEGLRAERAPATRVATPYPFFTGGGPPSLWLRAFKAASASRVRCEMRALSLWTKKRPARRHQELVKPTSTQSASSAAQISTAC